MGHPATIINPEKVRQVESDMAKHNREKIVQPDDSAIRIYNCFGEASKFAPGPQGFIVDAPAGTNVAVHWHPVNQFQIYVGTPGAWYQRSEVTDLILHYTDAYSTYGPFGSRGPGRLKYYTLRARASDTTGWMPEDREKMVRRGRRNHMISLPPFGSGAPPQAEWRAVIEPDEDGLAGYRRFVGPSQTLDAPEIPEAAIGRFYCVLAGALRRDDERFPPGSLLWQDRGQDLPDLVADGSGCDLLAVQFPPELDRSSN